MKQYHFIIVLLISALFLSNTKLFSMNYYQELGVVSFRDLPREIIRMICLCADYDATINLMNTNKKNYELILPELSYQKALYEALAKQDISLVSIFLKSGFINPNTVVRGKEIIEYATTEIIWHENISIDCPIHAENRSLRMFICFPCPCRRIRYMKKRTNYSLLEILKLS
jgi:hypothetical protein